MPNVLNNLAHILPYVDLPDSLLGPIPVRPFGLLVGIGVIFGSIIAERRAKRVGIPGDRFDRLVLWMMVTAVVISHVFDTLVYYPETVLNEPWKLLMIHQGLSSFGGFAGAAIGFFYLTKKFAIERWKAADSIAYGLPFGWFFGRMGCAAVHDHPGRLSDHFLAVAFPGGSRFDLGLLEMMLTPLLILSVVLVERRSRTPGTVVATLALIYPWIRFPLDFLRATPDAGGDIRYFGLTPGQYAAIILFCVGLFLFWRQPHQTSPRPAKDAKHP